MKIKKHLPWLLPIILMALITPFTPWIDMTIERYFYALGAGSRSHFYNNAFLQFIYDDAVFPAFFVAGAALVTFITGFFYLPLRHLRAPALVLILTMAIGAGLLVHTTFKEHWGRPRPRQVIEFGGHQEFRPYYVPNFFNQPERSKAFPCGHCTMGFYFFALVVIGRRMKKPWLIWTGLFLGISLGALLGIARMAQGGHFFSDVLMCALIMYLTAYFFDWLLHKKKTTGNITD